MVVVNDEQEYLVHHGIKGQHWGVRRFQNEDGTRTAAGKAREREGDGHSGIREAISKKFGVRRFQNEDGSLTTAGKQKLNKQKDKKLSKLERKTEVENRRAKRDEEDLKELKKNKTGSARVQAKWDLLDMEQKEELAKRGGYKVENETPMDFLFPANAYAKKYNAAINQLYKDEVSNVTKSRQRHIDRAAAYTKQHENLSMKDVDALASKYGYKEAKRQIRTGK